MSIFKSYDIRGVYPEQVNEEIAYKLGRALVVFLNAKKILVGIDARTSGPVLREALIRGILDQGADAVNAGFITTPLMYYLASKHDEFDGCVMVTASHNPKEYNGFKIAGKGAKSVSMGKGLEKVQTLVEENVFKNTEIGELTENNYDDEYIDFVTSFATTDVSNIKLVIDTGNGVTGPFYDKILDKLGLDAKKLFFEPDGTFPNHPPNPMEPESQVAISKEMKTGTYDLGVMIDADGDRIMIFDETGHMLFSSTIPILLCQHYYEEKGYVILDVLNYRNSVKDLIEETSFKVGVTAVGYTNIKDGLKKHDGLMGAEFSGHFSFKENGFCDNSALALVKILSVLSKTKSKLSQLVGDMESSKVLQTNFEVDDKDEKIKLIDEEFSDAVETLRIDGVSKVYDDCWLNVRKSNTEPLIRITLEAKTDEAANELLEKIKKIIGV